MLITHQHPHNKSLMVGVIGRPNVGKSSLINALIGEDLCSVSIKPQMTRNHYQVVGLFDRTEVVFIDTPGIHQQAGDPSRELNRRLNSEVEKVKNGPDLFLWLVDPSMPLTDQLQEAGNIAAWELNEIWLVFTKEDLSASISIEAKGILEEKFKQVLPSISAVFYTSVKDQSSLSKLISAFHKRAPNHPHLFEDGSISNKNERFFVVEYIREQTHQCLDQEVPFELCVMLDEFVSGQSTQTGKPYIRIQATILVNRPSQRPIVIGKGGAMIKKIGILARNRIEKFLNHQVYLQLHVKVSQGWYKNNLILTELGLPRPANAPRVWRKKI